MLGKFKGLGKKEKQTVTTEQKTTQELADYARSGSEDLRHCLMGMRFDNSTELIPEEKMETYKGIVKGLEDKLANFPVTAFDTREMDTALKAMVSFFDQAISCGYTQLASEICMTLADSILKVRAEVSAMLPGTNTEEVAMKIKELQYQNLVFKYYLKIDEKEKRNEELLIKVAAETEDLKRVRSEINTLLKNHPHLKERIEEIAMILPTDSDYFQVMKLNSKRLELLNIKNVIWKDNKEKADNDADIQLYKEHISMMENTKFGTNEINTVDVAVSEQFMADYKEHQRKRRQENKTLYEIVKKHKAMMYASATDPQEIDRIIETNIEYRRMEECERQEEARRIACEQKLKEDEKRVAYEKEQQKNTQKITNTYHLN